MEIKGYGSMLRAWWPHWQPRDPHVQGTVPSKYFQYLLTCTKQKALCVYLTGNTFPRWIWTPRCQTAGCSAPPTINKSSQSPCYIREDFSAEFYKAHLFSVNVFDGNGFSSSLSLPYELPNNDIVLRNFSFPFNNCMKPLAFIVSFRG